MTSVLVLALVVAAPGKKDAAKDPPSLVGEWVGEKAMVDGIEVPPGSGLDGLRITFARDGTLTTRTADRKPEGGAYTADPKKDPPEIDLVPPADKNEPPALGIYKIDGDTLTLCLAPGKAGERPKKLEAPAGTQVVLLTLKRAKKD